MKKWDFAFLITQTKETHIDLTSLSLCCKSISNEIQNGYKHKLVILPATLKV